MPTIPPDTESLYQPRMPVVFLDVDRWSQAKMGSFDRRQFAEVHAEYVDFGTTFKHIDVTKNLTCGSF